MKTIEVAVSGLAAEVERRGKYQMSIWLKRPFPSEPPVSRAGQTVVEYGQEVLAAFEVGRLKASGKYVWPVMRLGVEEAEKEVLLWVDPPEGRTTIAGSRLSVREVHDWLASRASGCEEFIVEAAMLQVGKPDHGIRVDLPLVGLGWDDEKQVVGFLAGHREDWVVKPPAPWWRRLAELMPRRGK